MWKCNMTCEKSDDQNHYPIGWNKTELIVTKPPAEVYFEINGMRVNDDSIDPDENKSISLKCFA